MRKRLLSGILAFAMILTTFLSNVTVIAAAGENEAKIGDTEYATLTDAISAATDGDTVEVLGDVTVASTITVSKSITLTAADAVTVKRGDAFKPALFKVQKATLTLSGALTIEGNAKAYGSLVLCTGGTAASPSALVMNEGVTLQNNQHGNYSYGGAVSLEGAASFTMNGGTIANCGNSSVSNKGKATSAGGGAVRAAATSSASPAIVMNDGRIENCFGVVGGAVLLINNYAKNDASFTMNGGVISGCVAGTSLTAVNGWGGAVFLFNKAKADADYTTATINGGEITGCKANEAGVLGMNRGVSSNPYNGGKYYVLGGHIYGNTVGYNGVYNGEPGKWYGQSVHVQGLSFNGEALLTIGGNALIEDEGYLAQKSAFIDVRDDFTGKFDMYVPYGSENGQVVAKAITADGAASEAASSIAGKIGITNALFGEDGNFQYDEKGNIVRKHSAVVDPDNANQYILGDYVDTCTVSFVADGVVVDTLTVDAGTILTDADYPAVPEKDGCTGEWNKVTDPITADTTIEAVYTPKAPGSSSTHVTKELFTIQCTAKHEHNWLCNWFGSHVVYNKDMAYDEARGVWTCSAYVKLGNFLNLTTIRNGYFGGMTHHYDVARPVIHLYWDPDATGLNSQGKEVTGLWLPDGEQTVDVYCYTAPAAPSNTALEKLSAKWIWMRDCNKTSQYLKVTSAGLYLLPGTYELGETYQDGGKFYCKLTITDLAPYVEKFNAKFTDDTYAVCEEHTTAEFTYVLRYNGSTTDYKQDGTGWVIDDSSYANNTEKLNGKTLWVAAGRTVTYTDGVPDAVIFEDQVYDTTKGSTTPAWQGEEPTREGYTFAGWTPVLAETVDESVVYTALWKANEYIVTFDANGGDDLSGFTKRVTYDSAYGALMTPSREGHTFAGWYDENGELVTSSTIYKFTKNTMLTAHWTINTFDVIFVDENGETVDTITVDWNTVLTEDMCPAVPEKEGYNGAWDLPADGVTADIMVKPVYTIKQFTVTFVAEGVVVDTITVDWNTVLTDGQYPAVPEKDGYTGVWNKVTAPITEDTTIEAVYTPKAPGSSSTHVTKELFTLHCTTDDDHQDQVYNWFGSHVTYVKNSLAYDEERGVWTAEASISKTGMATILMTANRSWGGTKHYCDVTPYTMKLYWDPNATGLNSQGKEVTGLWLPEEDYVVDVYCYTAPAAPSNAALEKMSANLMWLRDCNNLKQYLKVTSNSKLIAGTYEVGEMTGNKTDGFYCTLTITDLAPYVEKFNAKFTDDTYVVCEEHTTAEFTYVLKYTGSTTDYKQDGTGWTVDASSYENNTEKMNGKTLWVAAARTVTYTDGVSDAVIFEDQVYDTTKGSTTPAWDGEEPAREGYTFTGWNPEVAETVDESVAYVAQWTANQYWVGFDSNGGEDLTDYYKRVTFDSAYGKLPAPEREAYDFAGWYDENGDLVTAESIYQFAKNTMLTAHWTLKTFTVTFEAEGETVDTIVVDWGTVLTDEDYPEVPAKEGYTGAWNVVTDPITADTTIEAVYTINTYTVTFEAEGETVDTIVVDWGTVLTDEDYPEVPAKEGYTGAWNVVTDPITADTTIEAVYTINTYTVTFEAEGETVDTIVVDWGTVLTDEDYPEVPAKEGYTGAWNVVTDPITEDTTIEAVYTINTYTVTIVDEDGNVIGTITVEHGDIITAEDLPAVPAKEGYTGKWIIPADGITGDTTIVPEYTKVAPPVDTGDYAPIALPVALAGIAALVFCMKKREEDAE